MHIDGQWPAPLHVLACQAQRLGAMPEDAAAIDWSVSPSGQFVWQAGTISSSACRQPTAAGTNTELAAAAFAPFVHAVQSARTGCVSAPKLR